MEKIKIKDEFNLFRDSSTNAIVNTDMQSYNNYLTSKKVKEEESKKIKNIERIVSAHFITIAELKSKENLII